MSEPDLLQMLRESLAAKRVKHHPSCGTTYMEDCECASMNDMTPNDALLRVAVEGVPTAKQVQEAALRGAIHALMQEIPEKDLDLLHRIHDNAPWKGLKNCPPEKLPETYELLRRTVIKQLAEDRT